MLAKEKQTKNAAMDSLIYNIVYLNAMLYNAGTNLMGIANQYLIRQDGIHAKTY